MVVNGDARFALIVISIWGGRDFRYNKLIIGIDNVQI